MNRGSLWRSLVITNAIAGYNVFEEDIKSSGIQLYMYMLVQMKLDVWML